MAQKINPVSFRLGTTQIWNSNLQVYGKSYKVYSLLSFQYLEIDELIKRILNFNGFSVGYQNWKIGKYKIQLSIHYSELIFTEKKSKLSAFKSIFKILNNWFPGKISLVLYFNNLKDSLFNNFLVEYTQYLTSINTSSKKVIWSISKLLKIYLKNEKIIFYKKGILKARLKGFKISFKGRLEDSKAQMAKSLQYSEGNLPLNTLKSYISYSNNVIYTKNGTCGLKIWLFYEFY
uniref:30S ribosomal protein S3 n=1 Tax=Betaphycus gelatinus TaxID=1191690 RepID=A0A2H4QI69_9FLOR|nr:30S ribosomal protein S3 [Betaphycus gelatinus]ATX68844.1 30S ribosomal protein S3 [Betaphycus gelatinus]